MFGWLQALLVLSSRGVHCAIGDYMARALEVAPPQGERLYYRVCGIDQIKSRAGGNILALLAFSWSASWPSSRSSLQQHLPWSLARRMPCSCDCRPAAHTNTAGRTTPASRRPVTWGDGRAGRAGSLGSRRHVRGLALIRGLRRAVRQPGNFWVD